MTKPIEPANVTVDASHGDGRSPVCISGDINDTHYHFWTTKSLEPSADLFQHLKGSGRGSSVRTLEAETGTRAARIQAAMIERVKVDGLLESALAAAKAEKERRAEERRTIEAAERQVEAIERAAPDLYQALVTLNAQVLDWRITGKADLSAIAKAQDAAAAAIAKVGA